MADLNDVFREIAERTGSGFMPANSIMSQPYPRTMRFQIVTAFGEIAKRIFQKNVTGFFPLEDAFEYLLCNGEGCTLDDRFGKDLKLGDEEFDKHFRVKGDEADIEKLKKVLLHSPVRQKLLAQKNFKFAMRKEGKNEPYRLEVTEYGDEINIDRMQEYMELVNETLNRTLIVVLRIEEVAV